MNHTPMTQHPIFFDLEEVLQENTIFRLGLEHRKQVWLHGKYIHMTIPYNSISNLKRLLKYYLRYLVILLL